MIDFLASIWLAIGPFQAQVIAFALTISASIIYYTFRSQTKLIFGHTNNSFHSLSTEHGPVNIYCEKHYVQNVGRKPAEKVEIIFEAPPSEINVFPPRSYEKSAGPSNSYIVKIPYISPHELLIVDTIQVNQMVSRLLTVHCSESRGKKVNFWVLRRYNNIVNLLVFALIILGFFYILQLTISASISIFRVTQ